MERNQTGIQSKFSGAHLLWLMLAACCIMAHAADATIPRAQSTPSAGCDRIVEDRALGLHWRVEPQGGGRPNRMVLIEAQSLRGGASSATAGSACEEKQGAKAAFSQTTDVSPLRVSSGGRMTGNAVQMSQFKPVIQVGESIVVVQDGSTVEARFPAVALAAAAAGASFPVRLQVGTGGFGKQLGRVVQARAVAHGMARWDGEAQQNGAGW